MKRKRQENPDPITVGLILLGVGGLGYVGYLAVNQMQKTSGTTPQGNGSSNSGSGTNVSINSGGSNNPLSSLLNNSSSGNSSSGSSSGNDDTSSDDTSEDDLSDL